VRVWDDFTGKPTFRLKHNGPVSGISFSPDGRFAAIDSDGIKVWDLTSGRQVLPTIDSKTSLYGVSFSPDGKLLAGVGGQRVGIGEPPIPGEVYLWCADSGKLTLSLQGHKDFVGGVAFTRDGKRLVTASRDRTVRFWDTATGVEVFAIRHGPAEWSGRVLFSPDGRRLAAAGDDGVTVWEALP
jgi:WD40 repeat protein